MSKQRPRRPHNRFVTVYQQLSSGAVNTDGGFEEEGTEYCQRWCRAWPLRGNEAKALEHQHAVTDWIVEMRYDTTTAAINAKMWIVLPDSVRLNVTSVFDPDGRRRSIEIRARQVA